MKFEHVRPASMKMVSLLLLLAIGIVLPAFGSRLEEYPVSKPPLSEGIFPCSNCHAGLDVDTKRRELKDEHAGIRLNHAEAERWCLDCHHSENRDKLRLANGDMIDFRDSYLLCGQCHGNIYRDWKVGVHGKRTGFFKGGSRTYFLCVNCHNPHDPKFKPLKPEPPPVQPEHMRVRFNER